MRRYAPATLIFITTVFATFLGYREAVTYERAALQLRFQNLVDRKLEVFDDVLSREIHLAKAMLAFFRSSQTVDPAEFTTFAQSILEASDLKGIEWVPYVPASERSAFESTLGGASGVTELSGNGELVAAGPREEYFPVYYAEPKADNGSALGFDIGSEPTRRDALFAARDSGQLAVAGPLATAQDPKGAASYLLVLAHYRSPVSDVAERRKELAGFVVAALQAPKVLAHAIALTASDNISLLIRDGDQIIARSDAPDVTSRGSSFDDRPSIERGLKLGPRRLVATASADEQFVSSHASSLPVLILLGGTALSVLVALYLARLAATIARQRETESSLRRAELRYRTWFEEAPEAIAILDPATTRFIDVNPAGEALLKMDRTEFLRRDPRGISPPFQPNGQPSSERAFQLIQHALAGGRPRFEWEFRDTDGNPVECEVGLGILPGEHGDLVRCSAVDISERHRAELRQLELLRELDHRVKNCFATVLALAEQTARSAVTPKDFRDAFSGRVRALARAHEALAACRWTGALIRELAALVLGPYKSSRRQRVRLSGAAITLGPQAASAFSMILHELATNAAKYGALSVASGYVELSWERRHDTFVIEWRERNGPTASEVRSEGFGSMLIRGLVEHELGGTVEVRRHPDGLCYRIVLPQEHVLCGAATGYDGEPSQRDASRSAQDQEVHR